MSLVHTAEVARTSAQMTYEGPWLYLGIAVGLACLHGVRALRVRNELADSWLRVRGFTPDARATSEVTAYLRRLRIARFVGALLFLGLAVLSTVIEIPIGVVSGPYLLSVLGAELLTPRPRQGRERQATLVPRASDYFAPRRAVIAVRLLLGAGIVLAGISTAAYDPAQGLVHMTLLACGGAVYEICLHTITARGLPVARADLERDTAIRVASSRTSTAAAMTFAAFGAMYSLTMAVHRTGDGWWGRPVVNQLVTWSIPAAIATVIWLLQPVRSWRPRSV